MTYRARLGLGALFALLAFAGWRISHVMRADGALRHGDTVLSLTLMPGHPEALLELAKSQLADKRADAAAETARQLLLVSPVDGRAYTLLAKVALAHGQKSRARELFAVGARRAPRDVAAHAWLAQDALERGLPKEALVQIDHVLTLSPEAGATVFPVLISLAVDPRFAEALADVLRRPASWRAGMLIALERAPPELREASDQVLSALQRKGGFDAAETQARIQALLQEGRWGEAYARWASPVAAAGTPLPLLFNGDFASEPVGDSFDWILPTTPGVILEFEPGTGSGRILHGRFLGRRMVGAFLEHRLLLPPGRYELHLRQRAEALRSDHGLGWTVTCEGARDPQISSEALDGTRGWQALDVTFTVPALGCTRQWLRMGNAGAAGAGQLVTGDVWAGNLTIMKVAASPANRL